MPKLYDAYRRLCQAIGRKPQSTNAFKKSLDKLTGVYQARTSSGMLWQGIKPTLPTLLSFFFNEKRIVMRDTFLVEVASTSNPHTLHSINRQHSLS